MCVFGLLGRCFSRTEERLIHFSPQRGRQKKSKQRNYNTMKNKKNDPDRLEMNKYCRFCRKHTVHRETK